jgi:hypothetical protein
LPLMHLPAEQVKKGQPCPPVTKVLCSLSAMQYAKHYTGLILRQLGCNNL